MTDDTKLPITLGTCNTNIKYKIDSSSEVNILPVEIFRELSPSP